jgi:hypothetical protein
MPIPASPRPLSRTDQPELAKSARLAGGSSTHRALGDIAAQAGRAGLCEEIFKKVLATNKTAYTVQRGRLRMATGHQ